VQKSLRGVSALALTRFLARAKRAAGLTGQIDLLVTGNAGVRELNRRFRGKNQPTDVLSFPPAERNGFAGDIAISADIAVAQAKELGHSLATECKILILHGVLHLKGFDHEMDNGQMARKEMNLRRTLGLPTGLIERSHGRVTAKKRGQR
jgi:probable rRNA maturation factor